uniref:NADH dehydrogenase subunit 4 n=1 Tax=Aphidius colemani TaxID=78482 RepID=UPI0022DCE40E|nr:NADH dehydrogenase subunit 4 [Aphidius colemani]UZT28761.1 NADH dehydrogenase subunit 4 [Aphidius colemani]
MFLIVSLLSMIILIKNKFYKMIFKNCMFMLIIIMMMMLNKMNNYYKIFYYLGMDSISLSLMILTIWILSLCLLTSNKELKKYFNNFFLLIMIMLIMILMVSFFSINLMIFFIFFELSLIPIMLLILGWGMQINRIQATMYMIFYTLFGSLPLLMMIMMIYNKMNTLMFNMLNLFNISNNIMNMFYYMMLISAFLIKMPMYMVHLWLPKAHVEAPISGSMILAGIMLKLGSYGIFRLMLIFPKLFIKFNIIFIIISIIGSIYSSLICLIQSDMKIIVAYSSVVHMSVLMASMMTMTQMSFYSSIMMMIAHGLCSSGMFCLVNMNYERTHSRSLMINKGMLMMMPSMTLWWFLLSTSNFSAPPSLNLFSEVMLLNSLILWNKMIMPILFIVLLISTSYSIYLFAFSQYGKLFKNMYNFKMSSIQDKLILILHWLPLNIIFIQLNFMI